jgi:hypothetical protein
MKFRFVILLYLLMTIALTGGSAAQSPHSLVKGLYQKIVERKPLGIPKNADKAAIWPFLSKRLIRKLDVAQACEDDYFHQHPNNDSNTDTGLPPTINKPPFAWLEMDLFSGANEEASPSAAVVERTKTRKDGSFLVYVRLTYIDERETDDRQPDSTNGFHWLIAAVVKSEGGRLVVDDVLLFEDNSTRVESRLSEFFSGCEGSRWVGDKKAR